MVFRVVRPGSAGWKQRLKGLRSKMAQMRSRKAFIFGLRRAAQLLIAGLDVIRIILLAPFLVVGLYFMPGVFHEEFYSRKAGASWFRRRFPRTHFVFRGAWDLQDPHPGFSQEELARDFPKLLLWPPILNHVLNFRAAEEYPLRVLHSNLVPVPVLWQEPEAAEPKASYTRSHGEESEVARTERLGFDDFWSLIEQDGRELQREVSALSPSAHLRSTLNARMQSWVGDAGLVAVVRSILARFPAQVDHLLVIPWVGINGGSERVVSSYLFYLRAVYPHERFAVFLPDDVNKYSIGKRDELGVPAIAIDDFVSGVDAAARRHIYDRVLANLRPGTVHNINSYTAWCSLAEHGAFHQAHSRMFVNLYSDIRVDNMPIGYYHNYLPYVLDKLEGVICDNQTIKLRAIDDFGLTQAQASKFHVVPTPVIGFNGGDPRRELRRFQVAGHPRSLWMSRIAKEKRLDVLHWIAKASPERSFYVYGAVLEASGKPDTSWLELPNIDYRGDFANLRDLPVDEVDSYVFTSNGEGMPLAVLEAVKLGLPVVAPDVGGIGEMIDEETGWLIASNEGVDDYAAVLRRIAADPEEAGRRVARAQDRLVQRHSYRAFMNAVNEIPGYLQVGRDGA